MDASILDLRYRMKDVLKALDRNEAVRILYHGKVKGVIMPCRKTTPLKVTEHPFFGMNEGDTLPVETLYHTLRGGRYDDI